MGTKQPDLADTLFSATQQRVLGALFGRPDRSFYANELIAASGGGSGAVQRELARLEGSGLIESARIGRQKHYQANPRSPIFEELRGIVLKMSGATNHLHLAEGAAPPYTVRPQHHVGGTRILRRLGVTRRALAAFCRGHRVRKLSFFGSVTRDDFRPGSDVDVMVELEPGIKLDLLALSDLRDELSEFFGGRRVDVITNASISNPIRRESIARDLQTVYAGR